MLMLPLRLRLRCLADRRSAVQDLLFWIRTLKCRNNLFGLDPGKDIYIILNHLYTIYIFLSKLLGIYLYIKTPILYSFLWRRDSDDTPKTRDGESSWRQRGTNTSYLLNKIELRMHSVTCKLEGSSAATLELTDMMLYL